MPSASLYSSEGSRVGEVPLKEEVFGAEPHGAVMHQVMTGQLRNLRQGTASAKERAEVRGGGAKPWRQKGTGRARAGHRRSPIWKGGGTVFGPHAKDYNRTIPKALRRKALISILSAKAREEKLLVVQDFSMEQPKTRRVVELLTQLGIDDNCLIVTKEPSKEMYLSTRNIPGISQTFVGSLSALDLMKSDKVVLFQNALEHLETSLS